MATINTTDEGTSDFDFEFIFEKVKYEVIGSATNIFSDCETDEFGNDIPMAGDVETTVYLESATCGVDNENTVRDTVLLNRIELELYKY